MNYPVWQIPYLGGSWVIGLMACIHIFISHFAVGGGMFFALTEEIAHKRQDKKLYEFLKKHSKFFMLLTTVAGAVTGVGIWFTIQLVQPDGTATLIQNYTFGWATEYLFFVAELATVFAYYYSWDKISQKDHLNLARWYAFHSIMTLVVINGILTFMLTPGGWLETGYWGHGFFNPTYWPGLLIRIVMMMALAGMYALANCARIKGDDEFKTWMTRYSAKWFLPIFFTGPLLAWWYISNISPEVLSNIMTGIQSSGVGNFSILSRALYLSFFLSGTILIFVFVGPYLNPKNFSFGTAIAFMVCGLLVTSMAEWTREMLRKPYIIYNYMYCNGIIKNEIQKLNTEGFMQNAKWLEKSAETPTEIELGHSMFKAQCQACHTVDGYRSMRKLIGTRDEEAILGFLYTLRETNKEKNPYLNIMPPLVGREEEVKALAKYLRTLNTAK